MEEVLIKDLLKDNDKISALVDSGLSEVLKELENDGIIISPFCDIKNGNTNEVSMYSDRIMEQNLSQEDLSRREDINKLIKDINI
jgi:hypothetical protein